jgi:leader peptidase (prepilin peptidase) / N-methyltransferase
VINTPATLDLLVATWVVLMGACVGSFLNVVVARVPHGQSIVRPRSRCPCCGSPIAWHDNLPVLSWLLLRARCRSCRAPISARYPLVELLGAAAAWAAWTRHGLSAAGLAELAFAAALIALTFIDFDTWLLPNVITWPLLAIGLGASALHWTAASGFRSAAYGAVLGFAAFAAVSLLGARVFRREALGWGDVWLLAGLGSWLGMNALLPVVLLASVQGSVVGLTLMFLGKSTPGPEETPANSEEVSTPKEAPPASQISDQALAPTGISHSSGAVPSEDEWIPPRHSVPFGPFLAAAALEWLYLSDLITRLIPPLRIFH